MPVKVCFSEWSRIYFGQNESVFCFNDTLSLPSWTSQPFPLKTKNLAIRWQKSSFLFRRFRAKFFFFFFRSGFQEGVRPIRQNKAFLQVRARIEPGGRGRSDRRTPDCRIPTAGLPREGLRRLGEAHQRDRRKDLAAGKSFFFAWYIRSALFRGFWVTYYTVFKILSKYELVMKHLSKNLSIWLDVNCKPKF